MRAPFAICTNIRHANSWTCLQPEVIKRTICCLALNIYVLKFMIIMYQFNWVIIVTEVPVARRIKFADGFFSRNFGENKYG